MVHFAQEQDDEPYDEHMGRYRLHITTPMGYMIDISWQQEVDFQRALEAIVGLSEDGYGIEQSLSVVLQYLYETRIGEA